MAAGVASRRRGEAERQRGETVIIGWRTRLPGLPGISRDAFGDFYCHAGRCV